MIEQVKSYKTSDGKSFFELVEAQAHEIVLIVEKVPGVGDMVSGEIASAIVQQKDRIVDILTTTASSRPKARRVNGGTKKRKAPAPAVPAQTTT